MARKLPYFFQPDEEQAFLKACEDNPRDHCIFKVKFDTGLRISELVGDKRTGYSGLYFEDIRARGKGDKERMVLISRQATDEILRFLGDERSGKVFDITPRMVQKLSRKYAKKAGLPDFFRCKKCGQRQIPEKIKACPKCGNTKLILEPRWSPHKCRHTHITKIIVTTHDIALAQEQAGHASPATTSIYTHLDTEYRRPGMKKVFGES